MVTVTWDGKRLKLESVSRTHSGLKRLCAKLARRGFRIETTGVGSIQFAYPENVKHAHPADVFKVGVPVEWNG